MLTVPRTARPEATCGVKPLEPAAPAHAVQPLGAVDTSRAARKDAAMCNATPRQLVAADGTHPSATRRRRWRAKRQRPQCACSGGELVPR